MRTFWCPPPATDENLARVKAEGYNLTWTPEEGLDAARRHGLRAMLQDPLLAPSSLDDPEARRKLDALIERVRKHPALEAYFLRDEPSAADFAGLGRLVTYLRERDPKRLAYINLFPTYANNQQLGTAGDTVTAYKEHLRQFVEVVKPDLISYDHYHFFRETDQPQYFLNLGMIREAAIAAGLPFLNIIQASTIEPVWRLPNERELRWLVYTTLAYGGRGISYFLYWGPPEYGGLYRDGKPIPLAEAAAELNHEVARLSPALMDVDSMAVYHTAPIPLGAEGLPADAPVTVEGPGEFVVGVFGRAGKAQRFLVVNRDYRASALARVRLPSRVRSIEEMDKRTGKWTAGPAVQDGVAVVDLSPGDGRLFRWAR